VVVPAGRSSGTQSGFHLGRAVNVPFHAVNVLAGWAPNRRDLNPTEMAWRLQVGVWRARVCCGTGCGRKGWELFAALQKGWEELDRGVTNRLVASVWRRPGMAVGDSRRWGWGAPESRTHGPSVTEAPSASYRGRVSRSWRAAPIPFPFRRGGHLHGSFVHSHFRPIDCFSLLPTPFLTTGLWNDQEFASSSLAVVRSLVTNPASLGDIDPREVGAKFPALPVLGEVPMPWNPRLEPPMPAARTDLSPVLPPGC
jgi:hypothetical protein